MFYLIAYLDAGMRVYSSDHRRDLLVKVQQRLEKRTPKHVCPQFYIVGENKYRLLRDEDTELRDARKVANRKKGAERRAKKVAENKARGKKPHFITCPTCGSKSKKLRSEMGGLQTRQCKKGHYFEVDTFFGFESHKRRVERIDRPLFVMKADGSPGNYNDYIQGRYKDDPQGKMDMLKGILERDRKERMGE
jgi:hypothetical protein